MHVKKAVNMRRTLTAAMAGILMLGVTAWAAETADANETPQVQDLQIKTYRNIPYRAGFSTTESGDQELTYTIFAAYVYDDRHLLYSFDFANKDVYANYLETVKGMRSMNALIREDVEVTAEDKIITLVTCIGNQPSKRLLVQAVLEN